MAALVARNHPPGAFPRAFGIDGVLGKSNSANRRVFEFRGEHGSVFSPISLLYFPVILVVSRVHTRSHLVGGDVLFRQKSIS